jgi:hypothetical protein
VAAIQHQGLYAAGAEDFDQLAEAHEYGKGLLRLTMKAALNLGLHGAEILFLQPAQQHKPAAILNEGAHEGSKVG